MPGPRRYDLPRAGSSTEGSGIERDEVFLNTEEPLATSPEEREKQVFDPSDPACWEEALGGRGSANWLLDDPAVRSAIQSGRPHAVYDLFRKRLSAAPSVPAREALRAVIRNRRCFLESTSSPGHPVAPGVTDIEKAAILRNARGPSDAQRRLGWTVSRSPGFWIDLVANEM